ncbi:MAG: LptA/OstA family protein [Deltaproteobacteria bacterium]|jgi:lipopolysaccharide export system protein LptA
MKSPRLLALAGILVLCLAGLPLAYGAVAKQPAEGKEIPLRITAARLEADQKTGTIIFSGRVKALYGESTLYSDKLLVYLKKQPAAAQGAAKPSPAAAKQSPLGNLGGGKIDRIVAQGNVRFVQGDRVATGKEAIYYKDRDEVVLRGNPQLWQAENTLKGGRIIFNLKTNKVLVESSPRRRVEALLYSKGTAGGKAGLPFGPKTGKGRQP